MRGIQSIRQTFGLAAGGARLNGRTWCCPIVLLRCSSCCCCGGGGLPLLAGGSDHGRNVWRHPSVLDQHLVRSELGPQQGQLLWGERAVGARGGGWRRSGHGGCRAARCSRQCRTSWGSRGGLRRLAVHVVARTRDVVCCSISSSILHLLLLLLLSVVLLRLNVPQKGGKLVELGVCRRNALLLELLIPGKHILYLLATHRCRQTAAAQLLLGWRLLLGRGHCLDRSHCDGDLPKVTDEPVD